jgi:integrase
VGNPKSGAQTAPKEMTFPTRGPNKARSVVKAANATRLSSVTFRHTGASVIVQNGVNLRAAQTTGGWSTLRMVERYAHVDDAELQRAVRVTHAYADGSTCGTTDAATAFSDI